MRVKSHHLMGVLLLAALALAACGGGSSSNDTAAYGEAIAKAIKSESANPLSDQQADCIGQSYAGIIGAERFREAGIEPGDIKDLSSLTNLGLEIGESDRERLITGLGDCDVDVIDLFLQGLSEAGEIPQEVIDCIEDKTDRSTLERVITESLVGNEEPSNDTLFDVFGPCMRELIGAEGN